MDKRHLPGSPTGQICRPHLHPVRNLLSVVVRQIRDVETDVVALKQTCFAQHFVTAVETVIGEMHKFNLDNYNYLT